MALLADRFVRIHGVWFDIATAEPVAVVIHGAGTRRAQLAWDERCAALGRLRHTLLQPLIDYGAAGQGSVFEAYATREAISATPRLASGLVMHLARFLEAHRIPLTADRAPLMVRELRQVLQSARARPLGFVLQPRPSLEAVTDVLVDSHRGAVRLSISGAHGSGLRTFARAAARLARIAGYIPVCTAALLRWSWLPGYLEGRHLCVLAEPGAEPRGQAAASALIAHLAAHRPRPHLWVALSRSGPAVIQLEPFGADTMKTMTYTDSDFGPTAQELFEAARHADGFPGRYLSRLSYGSFDKGEPVPLAVHETAAQYGSAPRTAVPVARSRIGSVLWRAGSRAAALELRGRHAAAARLLERAARVLEGRGDAVQAAGCCLQLAWMARHRGSLAPARDQAARARRIDRSPSGEIAAGCLLAVCLIDEDRLVEGEGVLRSLVVAAEAIADATLRQRCTLALARSLHWQARYGDALALLEPMLEAAPDPAACCAWLRAARARAALGDIPQAIHAAREGTRRAEALQDARLRTAAAVATAEALARAGDLEAVRGEVSRGLQICHDSHLPLTALRLRLVLLTATRTDAGEAAAAERLRQGLRRLRHGGALPALLSRRIDTACEAGERREEKAAWSVSVSVDQLESFLDTAQRAKDDEHALQDVAALLASQLSAASVAVLAAEDARVVATAGRPWRERSVAAAQTLASGQPVALDPSRHPVEIAEPVKCAGAVIGAIVCRWSAATSHVTIAAGTMVRAAAMAIATHLRAVLDNRMDQPPPSVWSDLLGESAAAAAIRDAVQRASRAPFPVLIEGESGSGKELVARAVHRLSSRHARRFCAINCAALSDELVEAELFGHTRGAFTGATTERAGLFEEADGGTLFLDEIGELSGRAQAKLLRVLQEGEVRRVGENLSRRVDVRIVAATNRRLELEAQQGRFRTDLRFRLDVLRIAVPPLRERVGDIPMLAQHFWRQAAARVGSSATLGPDALAALARHDWPGNVRELQNTVAWMAVHAPRRGRVSAAMLPARLITGPLATGSFEAAREEFERRFVRAALAQAGGQRQLAARALGVSRQGLSKMLRRLRIEPDGIA